MKSKVWSTLAVGWLLWGGAVRGQQPANGTASATTQLTGTVTDSLAGRPLSGADIMVEGSSLTATTDSLGRFAIAGLPPGTYQVGVFHPRLDSLELSLMTAPFPVLASGPNNINLAIPSAATLISRKCGRPAAPAEAVLTGRAFDANTGKPVTAADIGLSWTDVIVSAGSGVSSARREAHATTDSAGRYTFCGLPNTLHGSIDALAQTLIMPSIPIELRGAPDALVSRNLFLGSGTSVVGQRGSVSGVVVDSTARAMEGARVEIAGTPMHTQTDRDGSFALQNIPFGTHLLVVRKVGYSSQSLPIDVLPEKPGRVRINMSTFVSYLDPIVVTARANEALKSVGFADRQKEGVGKFLTIADIQRSHMSYLTDIVRREVPGIDITSGGAGPILQSRRRSAMRGAACVRYFVDGSPWQMITADDINTINPDDVAGIEFYKGVTTPAEYGPAGECTTVLIWTKLRVGM